MFGKKRRITPTVLSMRYVYRDRGIKSSGLTLGDPGADTGAFVSLTP